jgi:hypothetical protein
MSTRKLKQVTVLLALGALLAALPALAADRDGPRMYRVTVTNLTPGQIISPPLIVAHSEALSLFEVGQPASDPLAALAEDGMTGPFTELLEDLPGVRDYAVADGPVLPGQSVSVEIEASGRRAVISGVGMLVVSNDAFFGFRQAETGAVRNRQPFSLYALAYDSGSEANTESCLDIPGPPCGSPGMRVTEGAEGFVHVHSGIHGIDDLEPERDDWRNPVVRITIEPLR